jgi:hypothetical protein
MKDGKKELQNGLQSGMEVLKSVRAIQNDEIVIEKRKIYFTRAECSQWGQFIEMANKHVTKKH